MPDKYGVGLGRNALATQYLGVQRPKKRKRSKDPMFIEFDAYDAQDGLMDEHNLNDIAKSRLLLRAGRRLKGRDMPAHVLDLRKSALRKSLLRKDRDGDGDGFVNDGKPNMRPVAVDTAASALKRKKRSEAIRNLRIKGKADSAARKIVDRGRSEEPKITADISEAVQASGGEMYGLDFRIKEVHSLARKLYAKAKEKGVSVDEYAADVADAVRYTAVSDEPPPGTYAKTIKTLLDSLEGKGYKVVELETHWQRGDAYNGVHLVAQNRSGQKFELQFHTSASVKAKFATHPLYEEMRKETTTPERRAELVREMIDIADAADIPQGAMDFGKQVFRPPED